MQNRFDDLSQEMYHRIYRMIKRNIDPKRIAATLNLPVKTITNIVSRINQGFNTQPDYSGEPSEDHSGIDFLDIYLYTKTRYAVIQLVGSLNKQHLYLLENELEKSASASYKALALRMTDVHIIDVEACNLIVSAFKKYQNLGRYLAILDPSPEIEVVLTEFNLEETVPIFGTERAFEDFAFTKKTSFRKN